uniref:Uncharacterized protein n=1 Tax=Peronospora matthiolae TaxID=2874970 RepID=A0AAV1U0G1_9STRA
MLGDDSHDRAPVPSIDELPFLRADNEEAKSGLLDALDMAERTRREQQGLVVEYLRQLESAAFSGLQQNESARARAGLGPSRRQRRRQGMSDFEPLQKSEEGPKGNPPAGKP